MTNTESLLTSLALNQDFKPDPGFSGELALWWGDRAAVLVFEGGSVLFQLYESVHVGDDMDLVSNMELSIGSPWYELRIALARLVVDLYG